MHLTCGNFDKNIKICRVGYKIESLQHESKQCLKMTRQNLYENRITYIYIYRNLKSKTLSGSTTGRLKYYVLQ